MTSADPRYVEARRVLLDALVALEAHGAAVVVAGAQAVYLHTGIGDLSVAPYTTDADVALDPAGLVAAPLLEAAMAGAGFALGVEPGVWLTRVEIAGQPVDIPVDLIVPEGVYDGGGRRAARLGAHGGRAARRARGLEAALIDHAPRRIGALDAGDARLVTAEVAGPAALLVAKAHKIGDRAADRRRDRLDDKDASDVVRLMQVTTPEEVGETMRRLLADPRAGEATDEGLHRLVSLFGRRGRRGIEMAASALRVAVPAERVAAIAVAYVRALDEVARR